MARFFNTQTPTIREGLIYQPDYNLLKTAALIKDNSLKDQKKKIRALYDLDIDYVKQFDQDRATALAKEYDEEADNIVDYLNKNPEDTSRVNSMIANLQSKVNYDKNYNRIKALKDNVDAYEKLMGTTSKMKDPVAAERYRNYYINKYIDKAENGAYSETFNPGPTPDIRNLAEDFAGSDVWKEVEADSSDITWDDNKGQYIVTNTKGTEEVLESKVRDAFKAWLIGEGLRDYGHVMENVFNQQWFTKDGDFDLSSPDSVLGKLTKNLTEALAYREVSSSNKRRHNTAYSARANRAIRMRENNWQILKNITSKSVSNAWLSTKLSAPYKEAMKRINSKFKSAFGKRFGDLTPNQKLTKISELKQEAANRGDTEAVKDLDKMQDWIHKVINGSADINSDEAIKKREDYYNQLYSLNQKLGMGEYKIYQEDIPDIVNQINSKMKSATTPEERQSLQMLKTYVEGVQSSFSSAMQANYDSYIKNFGARKTYRFQKALEEGLDTEYDKQSVTLNTQDMGIVFSDGRDYINSGTTILKQLVVNNAEVQIDNTALSDRGITVKSSDHLGSVKGNVVGIEYNKDQIPLPTHIQGTNVSENYILYNVGLKVHLQGDPPQKTVTIPVTASMSMSKLNGFGPLVSTQIFKADLNNTQRESLNTKLDNRAPAYQDRNQYNEQ